MSRAEQERMLAKFNGNAPASASSIQEVESEARLSLPKDYSQFLQQMNGGEGFIGDAYVIFWRVEELLEMNNGYQVAEYAPGLFLFGSNGGGEAFAFDMRSDSKPIVSVPFVGMELKLADILASDFEGFLTALFKS